MNSAEVKENKMGYMPVGKLLITMSLPMMASQIVQALYNIVDSVFVSQISESALTAVSLAFPVQMLMNAFANGVGVGTNAMVSRALGEKDPKKAGAMARSGIFLAAGCYIIFLLVGLFLVRPFLMTQVTGNEDPAIFEYGVDYLSIVCIFSFGVFIQVVFERLIQASGKMVYTMITHATGAIINIIFDPILIFGYFGFPAMGVAGAAIATVFGQIVGAILAVIFHIKLNKEIRFTMLAPPEGEAVKEICAIGIPTMLMQAAGSLMSYCMNKILMSFTSTATAVYGAYYKVQSFVFMPIFGMNSGMVPIIGYNYGAKKRSRIVGTMKLAFFIAQCVLVLGFFEASENMLNIGDKALRTISWGFLVAGGSVVCSSIFQAMGNGVYSALVSAVRQLIVLLPLAFIFSKVGSLELVWWAFPVSEIAAIILSLFLLRRMYKRIISKLPDNV